MNWYVIESNWKQFAGYVREQWGELTDDQLEKIAGKRDLLADRIHEAYGISKDEAEKQIKSFEESNITYKGAIKSRTYARIATADADYMIAKAACGTKSGNEKDLCVSEAQARQTKTIGDATANKNAVDARAQAGQDTRDTNR